MNINMLFCCFVVLTIATIPSTNEKLTHLSACTKGRITHYSTYYNSNACGFGVVSTKVTEGYMFRAALNEAFYDGANKCGICYEMVGADGAIRIMATDWCPVDGNEDVCSGDMFHFDLGENAEPYIFNPVTGYSNVTFRMVACDLEGNIKIKIQGSNDYYVQFTVMNHVIGLKSVAYSFDDGDTYTTVERKSYNMYPIAPEILLPIPFLIKLTSIADEDVVFNLTSIEKGAILDSGVQFAVPNDKYFDVETLETTTKPDDIDECCDQPDDVATVYDDDTQGIWSAQGWMNENTLDCTDNPYKGLYCLKAELNQSGGIQFWARYTLDTDLYTNLTFHLRSDSACDNCLSITTSLNSDKTYISINKANTWQYVSIPMESIGSGDIKTFEFRNHATDRPYYFDEVKWIHSDVDSSICADKYIYNGLNKGIGITMISILMIFIILI